jgi:hypothetical protein
MTSDIVAAAEPVVVAFEELGVRYRIGGSVASSALGVPRSTLDVDMVCNLAAAHVARFVEKLAASYYVDADMIHDAIARRASFNLVHLATMVKVDVFVHKLQPWDREAFARCVRKPLDVAESAREFDLTTPEDIVLHKLDWYRAGDGVSERQWRDAVGVMAVQRDAIDWAYLERWADALGLRALLDRARAEAARCP